MKKIIPILLSLVLITGMFAGCANNKTAKEIKKADTYADELQAYGIWDNEVAQELPQTVVHKLVMDHFNAPLPEGKKVKKAILLGYDGLRADGLENVKDDAESSIMYIKSQGGLYHTFSGGISGVNEQATSTSPSWLAMLTGGWGDYNGIKDNGGEKNGAETYLTTLAKQGHAASFTTSWREHTGLTYRPDTVMAIEQGLPVEYTHQVDDNGTYYQVLKYVAKPANITKTAQEDPDVIFFTFEHPDHAGHGSGFGSQNPAYIEAIHEADHFGMEIIKTIEARSTFAEEDWLIIIDADHGGTGTGHGGQTPFERMTWLATNKPIEITDEYTKYEVK